MGALDLLQELYGAGLSVQLIDGRIIVTPKDRLTDPLRDAIRAHRDDLVNVLKPEVPDAPRPTHAAPSARVYRLTRTQADRAHADPWDEAAIARFQARAGLIRRHGFAAQDAEDLAERLHLRDVHADYRHLCVECAYAGTGRRCAKHKAFLLNQLQRCPAFKEPST